MAGGKEEACLRRPGVLAGKRTATVEFCGMPSLRFWARFDFRSGFLILFYFIFIYLFEFVLLL